MLSVNKLSKLNEYIVVKMSNLFYRTVARFYACYILFVYKSSKVIRTGNYQLLNSEEKENFIFTFWHGDSYCLYPAVLKRKIYVLTTEDDRGNYIASLCDYFNYVPIRVPDRYTGKNLIFKIRKQINNQYDFAITLDGPLGPYHVPKRLPFVMALFTKNRVVPLSIKIKSKIHIKKRWDKFTIPLPFNIIDLHIHHPIRIGKEDLSNNFSLIQEKIKMTMERL